MFRSQNRRTQGPPQMLYEKKRWGGLNNQAYVFFLENKKEIQTGVLNSYMPWAQCVRASERNTQVTQLVPTTWMASTTATQQNRRGDVAVRSRTYVRARVPYRTRHCILWLRTRGLVTVMTHFAALTMDKFYDE